MVTRKTKLKNRGKANRAELAKRQNQRMEKRLDPAAASAARSLEIHPLVGPSERTEDAAVFNQEQRSKISEELQLEAVKVNESLELTHLGQFEDAIAKLKDIARSSPFSDWRLFVRGLHSFYSGDFETARQNWIKLEATRRPSRIASTLLLAETGQPLSDAITSAQKDLVEHAQTLRLRKNVVTAAEAIAKVRHRDPEVTFSVSQFAMLLNFFSSFRKLDPEFVSRVGQACVGLSIKQGDMEVFDRLKKIVPGPSDDPTWNRTKSIYMLDFEDAEDLMMKASRAYIEQDLPKLSGMSEPLKNALSCQIYLRVAAAEGEQLDGENRFGFSFGPSKVDYKSVHSLLRQAIKCYPTYRLPHEKLIASLKKEYDRNDRYDGAKLVATRLEKEILAAKEAMVRALPDEIEISLELIDIYLDKDELEKANALVKNLSGQRLEDPLAKALPWKLKLKEAMRLSRRKADLAMASKTLDEAELLWPVWLNKNWLPFLKAGLALRGGDQANFEKLTVEARESQKTSPFLGDLLTFAALQEMNIPGPDLKVFRTSVEPKFEKANELELSDLFSIGSFFWDLTRTGFQHKGYRMQASKAGKAFVNKLKSFTKEDLNPVQIDAFSWGAFHKFWPLGNNPLPSPEFVRRALKEPRLAAAILGWAVGQPWFPRNRITDYVPLMIIAKEAARTEKDAFYRYQFDKVSDGFNTIFQEFNEEEERRKSRGSTIDDDDDDEYEYDEFEFKFEDDDEDEDDSLEEGDNSDEELCDCPDCQADRARASKVFEKELRTQPMGIADVLAKLGPDGTAKLAQISQQEKPPEEFLKAIGKLFPNYGISPNEMIEFVRLMTNRGDAFNEDFSSRTDPDARAVAQSVDEIKAARKRREKELERKNREASRSRR